jgi:hypothetical protein
VEKIQAVANTLDPGQGSQEDRHRKFEELQRTFSQQQDSFAQHLVKLMTSFLAGLFLGPVDELPRDNLELERWFRLPKGHERRIHVGAGENVYHFDGRMRPGEAVAGRSAQGTAAWQKTTSE